MRTLAIYEFRVLCPDDAPAEEGSAFEMNQQERRVAANLPSMIESLQENLETLLPEGWSVEIEKQ